MRFGRQRGARVLRNRRGERDSRAARLNIRQPCFARLPRQSRASNERIRILGASAHTRTRSTTQRQERPLGRHCGPRAAALKASGSRADSHLARPVGTEQLGTDPNRPGHAHAHARATPRQTFKVREVSGGAG